MERKYYKTQVSKIKVTENTNVSRVYYNNTFKHFLVHVNKTFTSSSQVKWAIYKVSHLLKGNAQEPNYMSSL